MRACAVVHAAITTFVWGAASTASSLKRQLTYKTSSFANNKSKTSFSGATKRLSRASRDFTIYVCFKLLRWPNFPQNEFKQSLATARSPAFFSTLLRSRRMPSLCSYSNKYRSFAVSSMHQEGQPLACCLIFRNVLTYSANNSPPHYG